MPSTEIQLAVGTEYTSLLNKETKNISQKKPQNPKEDKKNQPSNQEEAVEIWSSEQTKILYASHILCELGLLGKIVKY